MWDYSYCYGWEHVLYIWCVEYGIYKHVEEFTDIWVNAALVTGIVGCAIWLSWVNFFYSVWILSECHMMI